MVKDFLLKFISLGFANVYLIINSKVVGNILDAFGDIWDVLGGETCHGDSSILCHVDVVLLYHGVRLGWGESSEREHTNLFSDMIPSSLGSNFLEFCSQFISHFRNSIRNGDEFVEPLLSQVWLVKDHSGDTSTVSWW